MIFCIIAKDSSNESSIRSDFLCSHKAYLKEFSDKISFAGPLSDKDNGEIFGSLFVMDFDSPNDVQKFLENEPYNKAGLFQEVELMKFENRWPQKSGFPV